MAIPLGFCAIGGTHVQAMFIHCIASALTPRSRPMTPLRQLSTRGSLARPQRSTFQMKKGKGGAATEKRAPPFIEIESFESDSWKLEPAVQALKNGGLGIIPTDTSYAFVTPITSREGIERIYEMRQAASTVKKPLSLLCGSISQIAMYTTATQTKQNFKMLKELFPGPYTFIFPASPDLPKMILEHKTRLKTWKRSEIGVRMPDDAICVEIMEQVDVPLLCATVPPSLDGGEFCAGTAMEEFGRDIDFYVDAGPRNQALQEDQQFRTTVVDFTSDPPEVLRDSSVGTDRLQEWL